MRKLTLLLAVILFTTIVANAQTEVLSGVTRGKDFGVVYTLPKTELQVDIKVTKVTYIPGEFGRYADRYLRLTDISGEAAEYWTLNDVIARSAGIPDSEKSYFVKMKDRTVAPLMELTADGIVKSINIPINKAKADESLEVFPPKKRLDPKDFLTEEILMASSTAKMAELTAREIYNIRESRNALVRGQADNMPKDGEQLKLMLDNLDEQEAAMLELFTGITHKEEKVFTVNLSPEKERNNEIIFRFSKKLGVVAANDLAGEPIYFTLTNLNAIAIPDEDGKKKSNISGIAYNVPGKARVTITDGKNKLFENDLPITQFGVVEYLAPELFNKNSTVKVTFNPNTGGLIKVDRE